MLNLLKKKKKKKFGPICVFFFFLAGKKQEKKWQKWVEKGVSHSLTSFSISFLSPSSFISITLFSSSSSPTLYFLPLSNFTYLSALHSPFYYSLFSPFLLTVSLYPSSSVSLLFSFPISFSLLIYSSPQLSFLPHPLLFFSFLFLF